MKPREDKASVIPRVADFFIKIVIIFASVLSLLNTARFLPDQSFILSIIALLFLIAIIVKGVYDMLK